MNKKEVEKDITKHYNLLDNSVHFYKAMKHIISFFVIMLGLQIRYFDKENFLKEKKCLDISKEIGSWSVNLETNLEWHKTYYWKEIHTCTMNSNYTNDIKIIKLKIDNILWLDGSYIFWSNYKVKIVAICPIKTKAVTWDEAFK